MFGLVWLVVSGCVPPEDVDTAAHMARSTRLADTADSGGLSLIASSDACPDNPNKDEPGFCGCDYVDHDLAPPDGAETCVHIGALVDGAFGVGSLVQDSAEIRSGAVLGDGATLESGAILVERSIVGEDAIIGAGTVVGRSANVGARTHIGPDSVLLRSADVGEDVDAHLGDVYLGYGSTIGNRCTFTGTSIVLGNFVQIGDDCEIGDSVVIARNADIGQGAHIGSGSVIGPNFTAGEGLAVGVDVRLRKGVVAGQDVTIGEDVVIGRDSELRDGSTIGASSRLRADVRVGAYVSLPDETFLARGTQLDDVDPDPCALPVGGLEPDPVVINTTTTITAGDPTYTCANVVVNAYVTVSGVLSFRSLTVTGSGYVTHNSLDLDGVNIVISELLDIQAGGQVNVNYRGGHGENSGRDALRWTPEGFTSVGAETSSSGGTYGARGQGSSNTVYGDPRNPQELGSGGGTLQEQNGSSAGTGGGRIDLTARDVRLDGTLTANGTNCSSRCGAGSGGAIRVALTGNLSGNGTLTANGGRGSGSFSQDGGGGRVAITGYETGVFTGTVSGGTVVVLNEAGTDGIYQVDGTDAELTIPPSETPSMVSLARSGRITADTPLTLQSLSVDGLLTMNAPLTVNGTVNVSGGSSNYNGVVTANAWNQTGGTTVLNADATVPTWTQSDGRTTLNSTLTVQDYEQTDGTLTITSGTTFEPSSFTFSNSALQHYGTLVLPTFDRTTVFGDTFFRNAGIVEVLDGTTVELASNVFLFHSGVFREVGGDDMTFGNLHLFADSKLQQSGQKLNGLLMVLSDTFTLDDTATIDVTGTGGFGETSTVLAQRWEAGAFTTTGAETSSAGGTYGARGLSSSNDTYGDPRDPQELGSGGGRLESRNGSNGGNGGGRIDIRATNAILNGALIADGKNCSRYCGGGSGGAIRIALTGDLSGAGTLSASGGRGLSTGGRDGGGGRVAVTGFTSGSFGGTASAGTVVILNDTGTDGIFQVDGNASELAIPVGETASFVSLANSGRMTVDVPLTMTDLSVGGSLTMNAPLTVSGTLTVSGGSSNYNAAVTAGSWTQTGGTTLLNAGATVPTWTQSNGTTTLNSTLTVQDYEQTDGTLTINSGTTFEPGTFALSNSVLNSYGTLVLPTFDQTTVFGQTYVRHTGVLEVLDGSTVEIASTVDVELNGLFREVGGDDLTFGSLHLFPGATLRQSGQRLDGLQVVLSDTFTLDNTATIDVSGRGARGETAAILAERWTPTGLTTDGAETSSSGGTYGTRGEGSSNDVYGDPLNPMEYGSGGGRLESLNGTNGGDGGGRVDITSQHAVVDGAILSNGKNCSRYCGGGSGGAIRLFVSGSLTGTGTLSAIGGRGLSTGGREGGGGRIAVTGPYSGSFTGDATAGTTYINGVLQ